MMPTAKSLLRLLLLLTALPAVAGFNDALVAHYPFNGALLDASGNDHHLAGDGVSFTANYTLSNRVIAGFAPSSLAGTASLPFVASHGLTVAGYLVLSEMSGEPTLLTIAASTDPNIAYRLFLGSDESCYGKALFLQLPGEGRESALPGPCIGEGSNNLNHFALTFDPATNQLRYNPSGSNRPFQAAPGTPSGEFHDATVTIGDGGDGSRLRMELTNLTIHNRPSSAEELSALMARGRWQVEIADGDRDLRYHGIPIDTTGEATAYTIGGGSTSVRNAEVDGRQVIQSISTNFHQIYTPEAGWMTATIEAAPLNTERSGIQIELRDHANNLIRSASIDPFTGGSARLRFLATDSSYRSLQVSSLMNGEPGQPLLGETGFSWSSVPNPTRLNYTLELSLDTGNVPLTPENCAATTELPTFLTFVPCVTAGGERFSAQLHTFGEDSGWILTEGDPLVPYHPPADNCARVEGDGSLVIPCVDVYGTHFSVRFTPRSDSTSSRWNLHEVTMN